jgi:hypothetical protein
MNEKCSPQATGLPGNITSLRFNLGTPKPNTQEAIGTFADDFEETRHLISCRPLKGIDPPKTSGS